MRKSLNGLKVSTALTATLVMFVALFAIAAAAAIWTLRADRQAIEQLGRANIERASDLSDLNSRLFQARADLAVAKTYMEGGQEEPRNAALASADKLLEAARASLKRLADNPDTAEDGAVLYKEVIDASKALDVEVMMPLHKAITGWNGIQANMLADNAMSKISTRYIAAVDKYQAYSRDVGRAAVEEAARTQERAITAAVMMLVGVFVIALLVRLGFRRAILRPLTEAGKQFDRIADGDLTGKLAARGNNEVGVLYAAMGRMQSGLTNAVAAVRHSVEEIHAGSTEIAEAGNDMSDRSSRQAGALQEASASLTELAATVTGNAQDAATANQQALDVSQLARRGGSAVDEAVSSMQGIATAQRRIAEIVGVVDGIAFQTNLLALNAAVEAARAGAQGRGFAVVAGEVRTLAQRSAQAAREIKELIDDASQRVDSGVRQVGNAGQTMKQVVESVDRITGIVAGISDASTQQAEGVAAVNQAVAEIERNTQENAAMVEETAAAVASLAEQAIVLRKAVSVFTLEDDVAAGQEPAEVPHYVGAPRLAVQPKYLPA
ncbi:methyl-accepting chemotaxis protein [Bordetella ansorpii]|uniref:Methyl-accepting chemotaxis protein n=1 Tax=Bordetella ansorpii TaxID=288768 RepID=A0A157M884_9BORD|nr:methyl-accepting chemotaxis protein [Bordetella ansorpii]